MRHLKTSETTMIPGKTHKTANTMLTKKELKPATINVQAMDRFRLYVLALHTKKFFNKPSN
jgi:hypothetical protein